MGGKNGIVLATLFQLYISILTIVNHYLTLINQYLTLINQY